MCPTAKKKVNSEAQCVFIKQALNNQVMLQYYRYNCEMTIIFWKKIALLFSTTLWNNHNKLECK